MPVLILKQTWLYSALALGALCLAHAVTHAGEASRPAIKPRAAAVVTPLEWSTMLDENDHIYACAKDSQPNSVLIARKHRDDENGGTQYQCATLFQFQQLTTSDPVTTERFPENASDYSCPKDKVMTGRWHGSDEEGETTYECSTITDAWGNTIQVIVDSDWTKVPSEKNSVFTCPANKVMTSRKHYGDENDPTYYKCATLW